MSAHTCVVKLLIATKKNFIAEPKLLPVHLQLPLMKLLHRAKFSCFFPNHHKYIRHACPTMCRNATRATLVCAQKIGTITSTQAHDHDHVDASLCPRDNLLPHTRTSLRKKRRSCTQAVIEFGYSTHMQRNDRNNRFETLDLGSPFFSHKRHAPLEGKTKQWIDFDRTAGSIFFTLSFELQQLSLASLDFDANTQQS